MRLKRIRDLSAVTQSQSQMGRRGRRRMYTVHIFYLILTGNPVFYLDFHILCALLSLSLPLLVLSFFIFVVSRVAPRRPRHHQFQQIPFSTLLFCSFCFICKPTKRLQVSAFQKPKLRLQCAKTCAVSNETNPLEFRSLCV